MLYFGNNQEIIGTPGMYLIIIKVSQSVQKDKDNIDAMMARLHRENTSVQILRVCSPPGP